MNTKKHPLTNRSASRLEESKQKVNRDNEKVPKRDTKSKEIIPKRNIDQKETNTTSKQSNGQHGSGVEGVAQFSRDDISSGICTHEDGVHFTEDEGRVTGLLFELLFHGGVAFA
jgi:hypothetical protein